ncbi:hypothetical protein GCM10027275_00050 [Rhabdobacter roseus]|uniref:Glycosyltransferase RgtA/B/C/D-like domain-containing protein n=1 Tax=Rhabdobacter roseus TaxID=1655419 RepID=A0A840TCT4_9BACT|nr:hypothetical protein [Rhabdobacter roseus]MBB5281886.1 hypothetical protein [Rhabdobacter roseus]
MPTFDATPIVYWALAYLLAGGVLWGSLEKRVPTVAYLLAALVLFGMMRLPAVVFNRELNPDESQMISHALTLYQDPVYWRSVDGTTIGPLDNYLLVLPRLLGFELNYTSARVMGLLCSAGALLFFFGAVRQWFGVATARVALLPPLFFLSFTQEADFVHYSSEQLPLLLLGGCLGLLAWLSRQSTPSLVVALGLGLLAGMVPFAKLQAVPQAVVLVLGGLWITYQHYRHQGTWRPTLALLAGGIAFPLLVLGWTLYHGVFQDLIDFYIKGNSIYAGSNGLLDVPTQLVSLLATSPDFSAYAAMLLLPVLVGTWGWWRSLSSRRESFVPLLLLVYLLASVYAATKSGNSFGHYLNLCIYPWALAAACGWWRLASYKVPLVGTLVLPLVWFGAQDAASFHQSRRLNAFVSEGATTLPTDMVSEKIKTYTRPGDYLVVWGWQCRYYVETQLAQGTAENHSERSIFEHPMREVYRTRYLSDLKRTQPAVFLDAVGKNSIWVSDRATQGHESFPALAKYLTANYLLADTLDDTRLYVRKDRYFSKP